eukprot:scaffold629546_cov15-Prasinocladus_malaysianus.AAC.1
MPSRVAPDKLDAALTNDALHVSLGYISVQATHFLDHPYIGFFWHGKPAMLSPLSAGVISVVPLS